MDSKIFQGKLTGACRAVAVLAAAVMTWFSAAAQTSIKVDAPNMVGADEQFNVTFIIEGEDRPSSFLSLIHI